VRYSQARNTPFQGLAADGAALALFALVKEGFRVVGFVHDEVLVELPDEGGFVSKATMDRVEQILVAEMEKVLGGLPAGVESTLSTRWSKDAKRIVQGDRVIPWSPPEEPPLEVAAVDAAPAADLFTGLPQQRPTSGADRRQGSAANQHLGPDAGARPPGDVAAGVGRLIDFIVERWRIHQRRAAGQPKPWTQDPILQNNRFCNVFREWDTETVWITTHWRAPHSDDPDLWFALVVARMVNWHETLAAIGYPVPWCPEHFVTVLEERQKRGAKVFTGAYTIPAAQNCPGSKAQYLAEKILTPMWHSRERLRRLRDGTLAQAHALLMQCHGLGSFLAGQIVADLKYVPPLSQASDWWSWAAPGPGSQRGLNRVLGRPTNASWAEAEWLRCLEPLHAVIGPRMTAANMPRMHAQDLQNSLCEWDKYERFRLGEGKPRSRYPGQAELPAASGPSRRETATTSRQGRRKALQPVLKWHGGKAGLAQDIIALMPPHGTFVEPFAGSAAVLLAKPPAATECLNDRNADLMNFYTVIQDPRTLECFLVAARALGLDPAPPPEPGAPDAVRTVWEAAVAGLTSEQDPVQRAVWFFAKARLSMSGRGNNAAPPPKNGRLRRGMDERRSSWLTALDHLPAVHARLQGVRLTCRPALEVIRRWDGPETVFFLDPPYVAGTRASANVYEHEMGDAAHRELLDLLRTVKGRVVLSGYGNALYDSLLAGWSRHTFDVANHGACGPTKRRMTEVVWANF
jgi:site-specific DNA-adenine methylase